jgi:hypothetical protein
MVGTSSLEEIDSPDVELQGRRFPALWDAPRLPAPQRLRQITPPIQKVELKDQIAEEIWSRLPWQQLATDGTDTRSIIDAYIQSLNQLERFRRDVDQLIRAACQANLEFRQALGETNVVGRDAALSGQLSEMLNEAAGPWFPTRNIVDARLASRPLSEVRQRLETALTKAVSDFGRQLFELMARLVDRELFGLVEWLPNNCCAYHFFKRVVIQENDGASSRVVGERRFGQVNERDRETGRQIIGRRTVEETRGQGRHIHRFARHQHDVIQAIHTSIGNSQVVMPPQVERLCEAVPEWLYPFVQVIDGTIVRERIIERDVRVDQWADRTQRDEPIIGYEPGVILGSYVLTGWGPREVQAEQLRRESVTNDLATQSSLTSARRRWPLLTGVGVLLAILTVALTVRTGWGNNVSLVAMLAGGATLFAIWQAAWDYATARQNPTANLWAHCTTVSIGCQGLMVLWLISQVYRPLPWTLLVSLAAVALFSYLLGRRFQ